MYVQVVFGEAADEPGLLAALERGPAGLLGAIGGTAAGGRFVAVVRFAGEDAARHAGYGPCAVRETGDVEVLGAGGVVDAGYVEVIEGRTADRSRFMDLERRIEAGYAAERPDFLGSLLLWWPGGAWVEVASFRSEAETRAADERGFSAPLAALVSEWEAIAGVSSTVAISDPWTVGSEWADGRP